MLQQAFMDWKRQNFRSKLKRWKKNFDLGNSDCANDELGLLEE